MGKLFVLVLFLAAFSTSFPLTGSASSSGSSLTSDQIFTLKGKSFSANKIKSELSVVREIPSFSAIVLNFTVNFHDQQRRTPIVGITKENLVIKSGHDNTELDLAETAWDVELLDDVVQNNIVLMFDVSGSVFGHDRKELLLSNMKSLVNTLKDANLPAVRFAAFAFADVGSLTMLQDFTANTVLLIDRIVEELSLPDSKRIEKYGKATAFVDSSFELFSAVETTLKQSTADSPAAHIFIFSDGQDNVGTNTVAQANIRLREIHSKWESDRRLIMMKYRLVLISKEFDATFMSLLNLQQTPIDGSSQMSALIQYKSVAADIAQDSPASYRLVACDAAREGAPQQKRELFLKGQRSTDTHVFLLKLEFSPRGFTRQGAAACNPLSIMKELKDVNKSKNVLRGSAEGVLDDDSDAAF